jgi:hypothetical protein
MNLSMVWLLTGDFERGWQEYEWRWKKKGTALRACGRPLWHGSPLEGRTILLQAEQGLGDTLQFIRYAAVAKERGGRVVLECPARLAPLRRTARGVDWLIDAGDPPPACEVYAPLLSLPRILGTTLASVPSQGPYLRVDAGLVEPASSRVSECASGSRGGRTGPAGLAAAAVRSGLPLAAGQRGQLLAPDHAPVPAAQKLRKNRLGQQKHRHECLCHTGNTGLAGRWHRHSCRGSDFFSASQSREPAGGDRTSRRGVAE